MKAGTRRGARYFFAQNPTSWSEVPVTTLLLDMANMRKFIET
nr:MAG TPA: hypothetical protein [Caudoviricetes sp.]DAS52488.1 MAG TPA: hypothetical protein [Caudoviricetes sp.]